MSDRIMVDTNVLVYAYDRSETEKQVLALAVLDRLATSGLGTLSVQILSEFFVTVTRKLRQPLTLEQAASSITNLCASWWILPITEMIVLEAVRGVTEHKISFWDAQIWASARLNQVGMILSEDFSYDHVIEGVRFVNPFLSGFVPDSLVASG